MRSAASSIERLISSARLSALRATSTILILGGASLSAMMASVARDVDTAFSQPAPVLGLALALAFMTEATAGVRNLVRTDLFMLAVLYLLTFLEFLFPQPSLEGQVTIEGARSGVLAVLLGFAGIAIGRHLAPIRRFPPYTQAELQPRQLFLLFIGATFLGYLHMLWAVRFNPFDLLFWVTQPRFSQPWTRGRLGGWSSLLSEFGLLLFLLPPLAGAVLAEAIRYTRLQKSVVTLVFGFTLFIGLAEGTRNVVLIYMVTFAVSYLLLAPQLNWRRMVAIGAPMLAAVWFVVYYLPEIRTIGLQRFEMGTVRTTTLFVDMNLLNVAKLTEIFPRYYSFLGLEVPVNALIRPIPRAIWPGKPEGLSFSIEEALGVGQSMTLAATFVGELYMAGGMFGVSLCALLYGWAAGKWNRVGQHASSNAQLILFASGFFAAGLGMRSFLSIVPALLPAVALYFYLRIK